MCIIAEVQVQKMENKFLANISLANTFQNVNLLHDRLLKHWIEKEVITHKQAAYLKETLYGFTIVIYGA